MLLNESKLSTVEKDVISKTLKENNIKTKMAIKKYFVKVNDRLPIGPRLKLERKQNGQDTNIWKADIEREKKHFLKWVNKNIYVSRK